MNVALEGDVELSQKVFQKCSQYAFPEVDLKVTELMMEAAQYKLKEVGKEIYELVGKSKSLYPFYASIYYLFEMSDHVSLLKMCDSVLLRYPNFILAKCFKALSLLGLERDSEASGVIKSIGVSDHEKVLSLKVWLEAKEAGFLEARKLLEKSLEVKYTSWKDASIKGLKRLDENPFPVKGDIVVFCVFKNEEKRIHAFMQHYNNLGAHHFIIVDNGSEDKTAELLLKYPNVNLFNISDNYVAASYGMRWINHLSDLYAANNWRIVADADELLVYPHCEKMNLSVLRDYLNEQGFEVVRGFMLDMFPEKLMDLKSYDLKDDPSSVSGYFDKTHRQVNIDRCPYKTFIGGSRHRIIFKDTFHSVQPLCKTVMVKGGLGIYHTLANHYTTPARVSDLTVAYLHYKFLVDWQNRGEALAKDVAHGAYAGALKIYSNFSSDSIDSSLLSKDSLKYKDSAQLIELGLISEGKFLN